MHPKQQAKRRAPRLKRKRIVVAGYSSEAETAEQLNVAVRTLRSWRQRGKASRPVEIAEYVRKRWWPALPARTVNAQVWHMAKAGKLVRFNGHYRLNSAYHAREMTNGLE